MQPFDAYDLASASVFWAQLCDYLWLCRYTGNKFIPSYYSCDAVGRSIVAEDMVERCLLEVDFSRACNDRTPTFMTCVIAEESMITRGGERCRSIPRSNRKRYACSPTGRSSCRCLSCMLILHAWARTCFQKAFNFFRRC